METEETVPPFLRPSRMSADDLIDRAGELRCIRNEIHRQRERAAQLRADLYAAEARIGELRGEFERLTGERAP
jgi:hypothetical protein